MARQHHPRSAGHRHTEAIYRRALGDRTHVESNDLRSRHQEQRRLRRGNRQELQKDKSVEELFFELALEDLARAADLFRPIYNRTNGVDGWVSLEVSPLLAMTRRARSPRPRSCTQGRASQSLHQDSRHHGGPAGDRRGDLRGSTGQRDAALLPRALRGRRRGFMRGIERRIEAGLSPTSARWLRCSSAAGTARLPARRPISCTTRSGSRSPSARTRRTATCSAHPLAAPLSRRKPAAAILGQYGNQGTLRRPTSSTSKRWPRRSRSTRCPRDLESFRRSRRLARS